MRLKEQSSPAAEPASAKPESESSWGELQAAGGGEEEGEGEENGAEASEGGRNPGAGDGERRDSTQERDQLAQPQHQQQQQELQEAGGVADGDNGGVTQETVATSADNMVGGDVVMVSPLDQVSDGGFDAGGAGGGGGGGGGGDEGSENGYGEEEEEGGVEVERRPNLRALMTMLVVSLRMQRLVHWVVRKRCLDGLSEENLVDLLAALEVMERTTDQPSCCVGGCCLAVAFRGRGRGMGQTERAFVLSCLILLSSDLLCLADGLTGCVLG